MPNDLQKICKFFFAHLAFGTKNFATIRFPMENKGALAKKKKIPDGPKPSKPFFSKTSYLMYQGTHTVGCPLATPNFGALKRIEMHVGAHQYIHVRSVFPKFQSQQRLSSLETRTFLSSKE